MIQGSKIDVIYEALGKLRLSRFCVTCRGRTGTQERIER